MKTKTVLGVSITAIFAVMIISSPIAYAAITDLLETEVKENKNTFQKITFSLTEEVKVNGEDFGGYAIFTTGGDVIAVTSHEGAYDSETQKYSDSETTFALCSEPEIESGLCGPEWHTHLVKPAPTALCTIAAIGALTYEEPSGAVVANQDNVKVTNVKKGTSSFTNSLTSSEEDFTAGTSAVSPNPVTLNADPGVAFPLTPVFDGPNLLAICIGPAA